MGRTGLQVYFHAPGRLFHSQTRCVLSALRDATTNTVNLATNQGPCIGTRDNLWIKNTLPDSFACRSPAMTATLVNKGI